MHFKQAINTNRVTNLTRSVRVHVSDLRDRGVTALVFQCRASCCSLEGGRLLVVTGTAVARGVLTVSVVVVWIVVCVILGSILVLLLLWLLLCWLLLSWLLLIWLLLSRLLLSRLRLGLGGKAYAL